MDCLLLLCPLERTVGYDGQGDFVIGSRWPPRPPAQSPGTPLAYIGGYLVAPRLFADAPAGKFSMNLLWDRAIAEGRLHGIAHDGPVAACGNAGGHRAGRSADEGLGRWRPPRHGSSPSRRTGPFSRFWPSAVLAGFPLEGAGRQRPWNSRAGPSCCPPAARCANSRSIFFAKAAAAACCCPRIRPIGDIDEDLLGGNEPGAGADIPRRHVRHRAASAAHGPDRRLGPRQSRRRGSPRKWPRRRIRLAALALSLQEFLDAIETEDIDCGPDSRALRSRECAPPRGHPRIPVDRARKISAAA